MNQLQLIEIWDAIMQLDVASEGLLHDEIKMIECKMKILEKNIQ